MIPTRPHDDRDLPAWRATGVPLREVVPLRHALLRTQRFRQAQEDQQLALYAAARRGDAPTVARILGKVHQLDREMNRDATELLGQHVPESMSIAKLQRAAQALVTRGTPVQAGADPGAAPHMGGVLQDTIDRLLAENKALEEEVASLRGELERLRIQAESRFANEMDRLSRLEDQFLNLSLSDDLSEYAADRDTALAQLLANLKESARGIIQNAKQSVDEADRLLVGRDDNRVFISYDQVTSLVRKYRLSFSQLTLPNLLRTLRAQLEVVASYAALGELVLRVATSEDILPPGQSRATIATADVRTVRRIGRVLIPGTLTRPDEYEISILDESYDLIEPDWLVAHYGWSTLRLTPPEDGAALPLQEDIQLTFTTVEVLLRVRVTAALTCLYFLTGDLPLDSTATSLTRYGAFLQAYSTLNEALLSGLDSVNDIATDSVTLDVIINAVDAGGLGAALGDLLEGDSAVRLRNFARETVLRSLVSRLYMGRAIDTINRASEFALQFPGIPTVTPLSQFATLGRELTVPGDANPFASEPSYFVELMKDKTASRWFGLVSTDDDALLLADMDAGARIAIERNAFNAIRILIRYSRLLQHTAGLIRLLSPVTTTVLQNAKGFINTNTVVRFKKLSEAALGADGDAETSKDVSEMWLYSNLDNVGPNPQAVALNRELRIRLFGYQTRFAAAGIDETRAPRIQAIIDARVSTEFAVGQFLGAKINTNQESYRGKTLRYTDPQSNLPRAEPMFISSPAPHPVVPTAETLVTKRENKKEYEREEEIDWLDF